MLGQIHQVSTDGLWVCLHVDGLEREAKRNATLHNPGPVSGEPSRVHRAVHLLQSHRRGGPDAVEQGQLGEVSQKPLVALKQLEVPGVFLHRVLLLLLLMEGPFGKHQGQALQGGGEHGGRIQPDLPLSS